MGRKQRIKQYSIILVCCFKQSTMFIYIPSLLEKDDKADQEMFVKIRLPLKKLEQC